MNFSPKLWLPTLLLGCLVCLIIQRADAAVVMRTDGEQVFGYVTELPGGGVKVRTWVGENRFLEREFLPSEVKEVLPTVDPERLAKLKPEDPEAYRLYAEELKVRKKDIEARELAMRLFLIHANLNPEFAGNDLEAAADLARSPEEAQKLRVLAFLADPERELKIADSAGPKNPSESADQPAELPPLSAAVRAELQAALRQVRSGNRNSAIQSLQRNQLRSALERFEHILTLEEIIDARNLSGQLPSPLLLRIVQVEVQLMQPDTQSKEDLEKEAASAEAESWSKQVAETTAAAYKPLNLETVTEFDPAANIYVNGEWQRPQASDGNPGGNQGGNTDGKSDESSGGN